MLKRYNLVPWGKKLHYTQRRQNCRLYIIVHMGGHFKAYLYTPRSCPQKGN